MAFRFASLIVAGCLLSLAQLLWPSSKAMAADALFSQPRITAAIDEAKLVRIPNNVVKAFNAANDLGVVADDFPLEAQDRRDLRANDRWAGESVPTAKRTAHRRDYRPGDSQSAHHQCLGLARGQDFVLFAPHVPSSVSRGDELLPWAYTPAQDLKDVA
jgi:hypothetical protein